MSGPADFVYDALPMRVVFGAGSIDRVGDELERLGIERALVLCTPGRRDLADRVTAVIGGRTAGTFDGARQHVPVTTVDAAAAYADEVGADGYLAVGGGSTIGLGKALALRYGAAVVALPTTYAGSEMTPIWGVTEGGAKRTGRDQVVLPRAVVYDPDLTLALPTPVAVTSGLNALAHAVEALYAPDVSPVVAAMAERGIGDLAAALPAIASDPSDETVRAAARASALQGAWLSGACLGATTMGLHHKLCHALGGSLDLPHAPTHAIVLPHVAAFNLPAAPGAAAAVARALGTTDPVAGLAALAEASGAPRRLSELGVTADQLPPIIEAVLASPYANPQPVERADLEAILLAAL